MTVSTESDDLMAVPLRPKPAQAPKAPKGVVYRMTEPDWRRSRQLCLDRNCSWQELITDWINASL